MIKEILRSWEQDFEVFGRSLPFDKKDLEEARQYAINLAMFSPLAEIKQEAEEFLKLTKDLTQKEYAKLLN
jgi:hypothetical protein